MSKSKLYARHGRETDALAAINQSRKTVDMIAGVVRYRQAGYDISILNWSKTIPGIGVNTHKLLLYVICSFTELYSKAENGTVYEVGFSIDDYIRITAGTIPDDAKRRMNRRNDMYKRLRRELMLLQALQFTDINGKDFESISPVCRTSIKNGYVEVELSRPYAEYLLKRPKTTIPMQLFRISSKSPTAYALGLKITNHYYLNKKREKGWNKLRVKNLLKESPLPPYDSGHSWKDRIRLPFERAMNELVASGILSSWKYEKNTFDLDYHKFREVMVSFEVIDG